MGIGMLGAILGGAAGGWGKGQMEAIKAKREEQLANLDRQFQGQQNDLNRAVQERQIASQEKLTTAQLGVTRELGLGQIANQKSIAELQEGGQNTRSAATIAAEERMNNARIASAKSLAEFQDASAQKLNSKLTIVVDPVTKKETYKMVTPDGQEIPKLKGPDGKELDWVGPDASTDAAKNYNFMIANGFDPGKAGQLAFGAKTSDIDSMTAQFYDSFVKSSFVTPDETKSQQFMKMARDAAMSIANRGAAAPAATPPAPAAGAPAAPKPAVPTSAAAPAAAPAEPDYSAIKRPSDAAGNPMDDAAIIAAVKADPKLATKNPAMVRKLLIEGYKVSPEAVTAAGF